MMNASQNVPSAAGLVIATQVWQTVVLLVGAAAVTQFENFGLGRGLTHRQYLFRTITHLLLPGLFALSATLLFIFRRKLGWWLTVAWNLFAVCGTVYVFLPYHPPEFPELIVMLSFPSLAIGGLFARSTRRYFALLGPIEAAQH